MREFIIKKNESNQRLDKYLKKLLPNAGSSFLYKMLRKKNITLNKKKAEGNETLAQGDCIQIFFSDETFDKFAKNQDALLREYEALKKLEPRGLSIVYEDADMLAANKPANLLSQKASDNDVSANELILGYLIRKGELCLEDFRTFRPSVCNRLDRNTTGLLLAGKSLQGLQMLSEALKTRGIHKYYRAVVLGEVKQETHLKGWLVKNEHKNQVRISQEACEDGEYIETSFVPIHGTKEYTMLEILLITGKSH